jgi:hypothetical protein
VAITTHTTITGRVLRLEELSEEEHRFLLAVYQRFFEHHEWSEFGAWWLEEFRRRGLAMDSPVYRICQDLEARIGIAQRQVAVPDYRDYLADLIEERSGSRQQFYSQAGIDSDDLSRVLAGNADLSLQCLQSILDRLGATLAVQPKRQPGEFLHEEQKRIALETLKAKDWERVHYLWIPRLYRKLPREFTPAVWRQVHDAYAAEGGCIDIDRIRCIVLGWADGRCPEDVDKAVELWNKEWFPALKLLQRITNMHHFEPALLALVNEASPVMRRLDETLDGWPESPPAMAQLLSDYQPFSDALKEIRRLTPPAVSKTQAPTAGPSFGAIATSTELVGFDRIANRGAGLEALLSDTRKSLLQLGWTVTEGKLEQVREGRPGRKLHRVTLVVQGVYTYLRPIYRRTFGNRSLNPQPLRDHISTLLSPFFSKDSISPRRKGTIWRAINNHLRRPLPD